MMSSKLGLEFYNYPTICDYCLILQAYQIQRSHDEGVFALRPGGGVGAAGQRGQGRRWRRKAVRKQKHEWRLPTRLRRGSM